MCIGIYSVNGHQEISDEVIKRCFKANPDGAGFMVKMLNGKTEWQKGFMNVESFIKAVREQPKYREIGLHMRIATDGGIIPANTHPFVISPNMDDLRQLDGVGDNVMLHNGIISYCKPIGGLKASCSDTMVFASKVLYPLRDKLGNNMVRNTLENAIGYSKVLIFRKNAPTLMLGHWIKDGSIYYTNTSYMPQKYYYSSLTKLSGKSIGKKVEKALEQAKYYINGKPVDEDGFELGEYAFEEWY